MTHRIDGRLDGRAFTALRDDEGRATGLLCHECESTFEDRDAFLDHDHGDEDTEETPSEALERPEDDPEALPPGYHLSDGQGGYYRLYGPDEQEIEGPSNGKWQGKDGAADAAWNDYLA